MRLEEIKYLILHCSDTEDGHDLNWPSIRAFHKSIGWKDIGYHFGIEQIDDHRLILLPGRPYTHIGAHCKAHGRNLDSLGICVLGRYDESPPCAPLFAHVINVLAFLALTFDLPAGRITGHREWDSLKTCPGAAWNLDRTRELVSQRLNELDDAGRFMELGHGWH